MDNLNKDELYSKIGQYYQQLSQVQQLLQVDPNNEQFLKLKSDLENVIKLTKDLIEQLNNNKSAEKKEDDAASEYDEDEDNESDNDNDDIPKTGPIVVKENVEVSGGDRIYAGVVTEIITPSEYKIKYFEFDSEVALPVSSISRITPSSDLKKKDIKVGSKYKCKYATDQNYYDIVVTSITEHGYMVKYSQYLNSEEVPLEYLKPIEGKDKNNIGKKDDGKTLIPIPENLKILPTDTEEEKNRKKKKLKAIKSKNRLITKEVEVAAVQQTWQKFVNKTATKKSLQSVGTKLAKKFTTNSKSDEPIDKVVGKGMTSYAERKRYIFNKSDDKDD